MLRLAWVGLAFMGFMLPSTARCEEPVTVTLTGNWLEINGQSEIPRELFGVHASRLSAEQLSEWGVEAVRLIHQTPTTRPTHAERDNRPELAAVRTVLDCFYDRYQPALVLSRPNDWRDHLTELASGYAKNVDPARPRHWIEFWNEPYLNWSVKPGVNYDGDWYDITRATEGGPVHPRGGGEAYPHLVWTRGLIALDAATGRKDYLAWGYAPKTIRDAAGTERPARAGDTYDFRGRKVMKLVDHWLVKDTSQRSYWAGQHNAALYLQMLVPFAQAAKAANPSVPVIAGFDFHFYQGEWDAWRTCFRPVIDAAWQWIDGVDEHHYGEDTRRTAASYEVVAAYSAGRFGKMLRSYNTEAGGMLDPQRPDTAAQSAVTGTAIDKARGAMTYTVRDLIYMLANVPDKAASRFAHEPETNGGDEWAFKLLKPLRGRLLECDSSHHDVWAVASSNAPGTVSLALFNDRPEAVAIRIALPADAVESISLSTVKADQLPFTMVEAAVQQDAQSTATIQLPPKSAGCMALVLKPTTVMATTVQRLQWFSPEVLTKLSPTRPAVSSIQVGGDHLKDVARSELRLTCTTSAAPKRLHARINGRPLEIWTRPGITEHPLPSDWLTTGNTLEFRLDADDWVNLDSISIVTTRRRTAK